MPRSAASLFAALPLLTIAAAQDAAPEGAQHAAPHDQRPLRVLLVSGANNHDWRWTTPEIQRALEETGRFEVRVTYEPAQDLAAADAFAGLDAVLLDYNGPRWGEPAERAFLDAVRGGLGVSVIHAADNAFPGWTEYELLVGLCWRQGTGHGRYHPFDVHVVDHAHPITAGMADLHMHPDELYHRLVHTEGAEYRVLMAAYSDPATGGTGRHEPMATAASYGAGRVFHTPLGHTWTKNVPSRASWYDPQLRRLVARGTEWAASGEVTLDPRPLNWVSPEERELGFERLFDGRSLDGWRGYRQDGPPAQGWVVRDAAIVHEAAGGGDDLVTVETYGDFELRFSWRIAAGGNSGVIWHVQETEDEPYKTGPEYQVLDDLTVGPDPRHGAAALYDLVPNTGAPLRPAGSWNEGRIVVDDGRVQHWLNGVKVVDVACTGPEWQQLVQASKFGEWPFGRAAAGHIALQDHGDEVAFRDLRIRRL